MKNPCSKCDGMAIWMYMPSSETMQKKDRYLCDEHIKRGCSCNIDPNSGLEDTDEQGRLYPCCEYLYNDEGFAE